MFIREVIKQNKYYPKKYVYHVLVESFRSENGPRQRTILKLGKLSINKDKWSSLAIRIEEIINGQSPIFKVEEEIENLAQHYASLIIEGNIIQETFTGEREYEEIDISSFKTRNSRSIGGEHVSITMLRRIKLEEILREIELKEEEIKIAEILIVGRMVNPGSEMETYRWSKEMSSIGEILEIKLEHISHNEYYRVGDILQRNKGRIEERLREAERDMFSLKESIILYDLTNTYFEGEIGESEIKRRGRSKDGRSRNPIVTLGVVIDEKGYPKYSEVYKGNIGEVTTLIDILKDLDKWSEGKERKTVIIDAGIASESNLNLIKSRGYDYIAVSRKRPIKEIPKEGYITIKKDKDNKVEGRIYREGSEVMMLCKSYKRSKKEMSMRTLFQERMETGLRKIQEGLIKKGGQKRYDLIMERIGRLKQKNFMVSYFYEIEVKNKEGIATEINWKIKEDMSIDDRFSGVYYLVTSRTDLNEEEIWNLYITLTDIEDSFRAMKSELGLRPNFHQKDERIKAHLFITILAYHILNSIQQCLHKQEIYMRWKTIRNILSTQRRAINSFTNKEGKTIWIKNISEPNPGCKNIYDTLNISSVPLKMKKYKNL